MHYFELASRRGSAEADFEIANTLVWGCGSGYDKRGLAAIVTQMNAEREAAHATRYMASGKSGQQGASSRNPSMASGDPPSPVSPLSMNLPSIKPDLTGMHAPQALTHGLLASNAGIPDSYALVGLMYELGIEGWVDRSEKKAYEWYLQGQAKNDRFAAQKAETLRYKVLWVNKKDGTLIMTVKGDD
jgi:TPR repeat protein